MIGNLIMWGSLLWLPILMYFMLRNETQFKKNIAVGVTFPFEGRRHPEVLARLEAFKKQELWACIGLMATGIPCIFLSFSTSFRLWFVWILLTVIVPYIPYVLCNRDLKRIKEAHGWKRKNSGEITVDLSAIPKLKWLSPWAFVPALLLSLAPMLWERDFAFLYLLDAAMVILFWLGYRYLFRQKAETVDDNAELTLVLTRIRQCQWGKLWLLCAYTMAALNVGISLTKYHVRGQLIVILLFSVVIVAASISIEMRTRKLQERLTQDSGKGYYVDDDDKWLGGIVYYNPNDSRLLINDRVGTNSGLNLAKPMGKVLYALLALLLLTIPFYGVLIDMDGGALTLELTDNQLQVSDKYTIPLEDVTEVTLLTELPPVSRVFGIGLPTYLQGTFSSPDYGKLKLCLNPTVSPYILIETETEQYLVGTRDPALTHKIFDAME